MAAIFSRVLNSIFVFVVCGILLGAFAVQLLAGELPCPLCLLQRLAMLGVGLGAMLNVVYGSNPQHYGVALASAIFGGTVAGRQILLHIVPGSGAYGSAFFGLHLYTWSFIAFVGTGIVLSAMLLLDRPTPEATAAKERLGLFSQIAIGLLVAVAAANFVGALLLCGLGNCPGDPQSYAMLTWLS